MCRLLCWILGVFLVLTAVGACGPRAWPPPPAALTFQPGRYVRESYFTPNFRPTEIIYSVQTFTLAPASKVPAENFPQIFQEELNRAWQAQGLKVGSGKDACRLSGTIHHLSVRGTRLRWLTGRLHAALTISGTVTRGEQVLFAFRDQVYLSSPLAPGLAAPKEKDLLLHQLSRETVHHLLNELLLHRPTAESG